MSEELDKKKVLDGMEHGEERRVDEDKREEIEETRSDVSGQVEIVSLADNRTMSDRIERFLYKLRYQINDRWFEWKDLEKGKVLDETVRKIQQNLYRAFDIPRGDLVGIDCPEINAFVVKNNSDIFLYSGLLNAMKVWCERHGEPFTEDMIAFVVAHEMTHIEQGTEETIEEEQEYKYETRQKGLNKEYDADRSAIIRMANAGYNPKEGLKAIKFLQSLGNGIPFYSSHPRSNDRNRELQDLVFDVDGFLPNISKKPSVLSSEFIDAVASATVSHVPEDVYLEKGRERLPEIIKNLSHLTDSFEVARMAFEHDKNQVLLEECDKDYVKEFLARSLFLDNLGRYLSSLNVLGSSELSYYSSPRPRHIFAQSEYEYPERDKDKSESVDNEVVKEAMDTCFGNSVRRFQSISVSLLGEIDKAEDILKMYIEKKHKGEKIYSSYDNKSIEQIQEKLEELESVRVLIENFSKGDNLAVFLADITVADLDTMIEGSDLDEENIPVMKDEGDLVAWARSQANGYFKRESKRLDEEVKKMSYGILEVEDSYEPFIDREKMVSEDLRTEEGRRQYIRLLGMYEVDSEVFDMMTLAGFKDLEESEGQAALKDFEPFDTGMNGDYIERLVPELEKQLAEHYQKRGIKGYREFAEIMMALVFNIAETGYRSEELIERLRKFDDEDLSYLAESLPFPSMSMELSVNSMLTRDLSLRENDFVFILSLWEREIGEKIRALDVVNLSVEERMQQILSTVKYSASEEVAYVLINEYMQFVAGLEVSTAQELEVYVKPLLDLIEGNDRRFLFEAIVGMLEGKLSVIELLKLHDGEAGDSIKGFLKKYWFDKDKRKLMTEDEQKMFLDVLFENVEAWESKSIWGDAGVFEKHNRDVFLPDLMLDYIELNQDRLSSLELLKKIFTEGHVCVGNWDKEREYKDRLREIWESLSLDELKEFYEFALEMEENRKSQAEGATKWNENRLSDLLGYTSRKIISDLNGIEGVVGYSQPLNDEIPLNENLAYVCRYGSFARRGLLDKIYETYFSIVPGDDEVVKLVENYSENSHAYWPEGFVNEYGPFGISSNRPWISIFDLPFDLVEAAEKYDKEAKSAFVSERRRYRSTPSELMARYLHIKGVVFDDRTRRPDNIDFGEHPTAVIETMLERVEEVVKRVPEKSNFRDERLQDLEKYTLMGQGIVEEGHRLFTEDGGRLIQEQAKYLYEFYKYGIKLLADQDFRLLWSRRADYLFREYLDDGEANFDGELDRILELYPVASFGRDNALLRLGNSNHTKLQAQSDMVRSLLFENQRRTKDDYEENQQSVLESFGEKLSYFSRSEKRDLILWIIGAKGEAPLSLRAYGGKNEVQFEDLPAIIFAGTPQEREELLLRVLYGENGVMEPRGEEDMEIFEDLLSESFKKIFPDEQLEGEGREVVETIFMTIFREYPPFRRAKIYISMIEVLHEGGDKGNMARKIRVLLEQLGPVFIKAGQVLSEEEDSEGRFLLSEDLRNEFRDLKEDVKSFNRTAVFQILDSMGEFEEENLDRLVEVDRKLGSASIKVVYKALNANGNTEVVKVRRPSIGKYLDEDMWVLGSVVSELQKIEGITVPRGIDRKIERWIREEANFETEVENHQALQGVLDGYERKEMIVRTPKIRNQSTEHICEEYIEGLSLNDLLDVKAGREDLEVLLNKTFSASDPSFDAIKRKYEGYLDNLDQVRLLGFDSLMYQVFKHGIFHSDMHAGNIFVTPHDELVLIDVGSAGKVEMGNIESLKEFFYGFLFMSRPEFQMMMGNRDPSKMLSSSLKEFLEYDESDDEIVKELQEIFSDVEKIASGGGDSKKKLGLILERLHSDNIKVDPGFEKFLKAIATASYLTQKNEFAALQSIVSYAPIQL